MLTSATWHNQMHHANHTIGMTSVGGDMRDETIDNDGKRVESEVLKRWDRLDMQRWCPNYRTSNATKSYTLNMYEWTNGSRGRRRRTSIRRSGSNDVDRSLSRGIACLFW
jgi:hypothetical protein